MDAFENCFQNSATLLVDDASLTTVRNYKVLEELSPNVENNFNKKYAFIGFVLGALIGIVIVMVWNVYHEKAWLISNCYGKELKEWHYEI